MLTPIIKKNSRIDRVEKISNGVNLVSERGITRIMVYEEDIFRVSYIENGAFEDVKNEAQATEFEAPADGIEFTVTEEENCIAIATAKLVCRVVRDTASVSFEREGRRLFSEADKDSKILEDYEIFKNVGNIKVEEIKTADGVKKRITSADKEYDRTLSHTRLKFVLDENERVFGLGQAEEGIWNLRGTTQYLHQANRKIAVPFMISDKGYGILLSTQSPAVFSDTQYGTYFYTVADCYLDYFFMAPEKKSGIVANMRRLTGKALIPPKWAFGYVQSQERYESEQEILEVAQEFKNRDIPVSALVLDWISWEEGMWGQKSFDRTRFPHPDKMVEKLHEDDIHFMISIWPSMAECTDNYKEMAKAGKLLNGVNIVNAFDESARELYWKQANEGLAQYGIESWWCDSSEPITPEWNHLERPLPEAMFSEYIKTAEDVMPVEKSNAYGLYHARGMYEGQKRDYPNRRMLILTRNGYVGSQKYGVTLWSGDTDASWKTLKDQLVAAVQFSLSGIPYWTFDIGAFFVRNGINWYWNGDYPEANENTGYRELYTRWLQLGAFLPMFRAHGTDCRREPWAFEDEDNIFYNTIVDFIKLRYKLMPYIYSVAARVWKNDEMFIRPLFTEFDDEAVADIANQFMFGPSIMVCPVTEAMYYDKQGKAIDGDKHISVYLPKNNTWYDWWTGEKYEGGQWIKADAEISKMPLYVRAGSIIPIASEAKKSASKAAGEENKNFGVMSTNDVEILRFPREDGTCDPFELYEDAGDGYEYLDGKYSITILK